MEMKLIRNEQENPHFLVLTEEHVLMIEATQKALVWHFETNAIDSVEQLRNGVMVRLKREYDNRRVVGI